MCIALKYGIWNIQVPEPGAVNALVTGGYFTDLMSVIYYGVTVLLVEFGKVFIAGLALHLLTDIAYNTFKNRKK